MPTGEDNVTLRRLLLRELGKRLAWSSLAYALIAALSSLKLEYPARELGLCMAGMLFIVGVARTLYSRRLIGQLDIDNNGKKLIQVTATQSLLFCLFVSFAVFHVWGRVIPECLLIVAVTGISSASATLFAPIPNLDRLCVSLQVLPAYVWAMFAIPRYGWLLPCLILIHAVAMAKLISMNSEHIREMFVAQLTLEAQSEDLRLARDAAEEAGSAKMRFLANMSHEIRTPLNGILGLVQVLRNLPVSAEQRELLEDIALSGQHLTSIVNDVLDMAKVSSGKLLPEEVEFNLHGLIHELESPAAALAEVRRLRFAVELPPDLPRRVKGDPLRTRQVVSNLLSNAVKFTPAGEVRLTVTLPQAGWVRFEVSDTGIGLSEEQMASLFKEFHQVDSSTTRKFGGSGLGLAISRRLAELMGGRLWVDSHLGNGSRFYFELPLMAASAERETQPALTPPPCLRAGLRVLVVEDNHINQKVMLKLISQAGARVELAENGQVAIDLHQADPYDVILMDCQMPVLDGYAATSLIRALPGKPSQVPIIGVTANAFAEDRERCLHAGMNGYVAKPLSRDALLAALSQALLTGRT